MSNIFELLHLSPEHKQDGDYGIEIEMEGAGLGAKPRSYWRVDVDHSLRNGGVEYILKKPIVLNAVSKAVGVLNDTLKESGAAVKFSFRTSVHVHLNVQKLEEPTLLNIIYVYSLLENVMINYCGDERKGNRFCLRSEDSEGVIDLSERLFKNGIADIGAIPRDMIRYSSLNLEALMKYGSIEFRGLAGTMDAKRITDWCKAIDAIKQYALKHESPVSIFNRFRELHTIPFVKEVLGDVFKEFEYKGMDKDIIRNFSLSLDYPAAYAIYEKKQKVKKEKAEKEPEEAPEIEMLMIKPRPAINAADIRWENGVDGHEHVVAGLNPNRAVLDEIMMEHVRAMPNRVNPAPRVRVDPLAIPPRPRVVGIPDVEEEPLE